METAEGMEIEGAPVVSIGLPVYNGGEALRRALDSLLAQIYESLEIVISDNASTDETEAICRDYAARDRRVRYLRNDTNIGAVANFNRAFELTCGSYFMWASHDDTWSPEYVATCMERHHRLPGLALVGTEAELTDPDTGAPLSRNYGCTTVGLEPAARFRRYLQSLQGGATSTRSCSESIGEARLLQWRRSSRCSPPTISCSRG